MRYKLAHISLGSVFKVTFVLGLILGLIAGILYALIMTGGVVTYGFQALPLGYGVAGAIAGGIVGGIVAAIIAVIYAFLYNVTARITGGLEFDLSEAAVYPGAQMAAPTPGYAAPRSAEAAPRCPRCGGPLRYIKEYERWWCDSCRQYV